MEKNRLEAFSDGVIAIIITIMVLDIKAPETADWGGLIRLWPVFLSYVLSFAFVGIYWGNHHHLLHTVRRVNAGIMWANLHLLFWLSLVPVATAWMGRAHFSANTVAAYAVLLTLNAVAYNFLQRCIAASQPHDEAMQRAIRHAGKKGAASLIAYLVAIPLAYWEPWVSMCLFVAVAVAWFIPDRGIERALGEK